MLRPVFGYLLLPLRYHFWGSFFILIFASMVIYGQISDRYRFAKSELRTEVAERWGAPIEQPVPSLRYVESGAVFRELEALPLSWQRVGLTAGMSYRKRGLTYFSGFEFGFQGSYGVVNDLGKSIDLVFVFPIQMSSNRVLLSDLVFRVNGESAPYDLSGSEGRLVWTGRLAEGEELAVEIAFQGQGLDSFTYVLDPALPVRDFELEIDISGGEGFDYGPGVLPATEVRQEGDRTLLTWRYGALESGVPVGVILPSEKGFDQIIAIMIRRAWPTFLLFYLTLVALWAHRGHRPPVWEAYLISATYAFFYVLLPYLTAYMHFYLAYGLSLLLVGGLLVLYLGQTLGKEARLQVLAALAAFLLLPTVAVIPRQHTGLLYTLEILAGLSLLLTLSTLPLFSRIAGSLRQQAEKDWGRQVAGSAPEEVTHG